ncbi:hypothetical protein HPB48_002315 [Haemaphysalis longicornis]|uniref:CUB domain-containing protein n=1 Tax=Haemaphysalis longicornis TaxID=44386 RepID=A0A9J6FWS1_HAELO|nr:hypothetical protein HPB48_002315 [Haemaphysalis longicornis]
MAFQLVPVALLLLCGLPLASRGSPATYVPYTMEDSCDGLPRTIHIPAPGPGAAIIVRSHEGAHYKPGLTCHFTVKTNKAYRIVVVFDALQFPGSVDNCSDALQISGTSSVNSPICSSTIKEVSSKANFLNLTWITGVGTAPSVEDGFEAVITAYRPVSWSCSSSEYKCDNSRCVDKNLACDGHNNCGDNSDETCGFWWLMQFASGTWVMMVTVCCCCVLPSVMHAIYARDDQPNMEPIVIEQNVATVPPSGPNVGSTPFARQESLQPYQNNRITAMPVYGVTGIPVNLVTNRQMQLPHGPSELANVDYPRSGVNPVVMSVAHTTAFYLPNTSTKPEPLPSSAPKQGQDDLHGVFCPAKAQSPQRARMTKFPNSKPPFSLQNPPDPICAFSGFTTGTPVESPTRGPTEPPIIAGISDAMVVPWAGPTGGPSQDIRCFITFGTTGDETRESSDVGLLGTARAPLPSDTVSSNLDTVSKTILVTKRQQQREGRTAEDGQRPISHSGCNERLNHYRRHRRKSGGTKSSGRISGGDRPHAGQVDKDEKNDAKKAGNAVPTTVTPTGIDAAGAQAILH